MCVWVCVRPVYLHCVLCYLSTPACPFILLRQQPPPPSPPSWREVCIISLWKLKMEGKVVKFIRMRLSSMYETGILQWQPPPALLFDINGSCSCPNATLPSCIFPLMTHQRDNWGALVPSVWPADPFGWLKCSLLGQYALWVAQVASLIHLFGLLFS